MGYKTWINQVLMELTATKGEIHVENLGQV